MPRIKRVLVLAFVLFVPAMAMALMPPHITSVPGHGTSLVEGRIVKFRGYTLGGVQSEVQDSHGESVVVEQFLWTRVECRRRPGPCDNSGGPVAPGAEQTFAVLSVKLPPPSEGASYSVTLLDSTVHIDTRDGAYVVR